eukprot:2504341-Pleurochrysis_carterae.AAC.1
MRVASSSVMSLLSAADSSLSMPDAVLTCIASTRHWPLRERCADLGGGSHVAAESVTPRLVEGLDDQRKRKDIAVLVGWAFKFFLRFCSQVRGVGQHRKELEPALIFA